MNIYLHLTANRPAVVTTATEVAAFTNQPIAKIDGLVGPFESTDHAAVWAAGQGMTLAVA